MSAVIGDDGDFNVATVRDATYTLSDTVFEAIGGVQNAFELFVNLACHRFANEHALAQHAVDSYRSSLGVYMRVCDAVIAKYKAPCSTWSVQKLRRYLDFCINGDVNGRDEDNEQNIDMVLYIAAQACLGAESGVRQTFKLRIDGEIDVWLVQRALSAAGVAVGVSFADNDSESKTVQLASAVHRWNEGEKIIVHLTYPTGPAV